MALDAGGGEVVTTLLSACIGKPLGEPFGTPFGEPFGQLASPAIVARREGVPVGEGASED